MLLNFLTILAWPVAIISLTVGIMLLIFDVQHHMKHNRLGGYQYGRFLLVGMIATCWLIATYT